MGLQLPVSPLSVYSPFAKLHYGKGVQQGIEQGIVHLTRPDIRL